MGRPKVDPALRAPVGPIGRIRSRRRRNTGRSVSWKGGRKRDYAKLIDGYVRDVLDGRIPACKWFARPCSGTSQSVRTRRSAPSPSTSTRRPLALFWREWSGFRTSRASGHGTASSSAPAVAVLHRRLHLGLEAEERRASALSTGLHGMRAEERKVDRRRSPRNRNVRGDGEHGSEVYSGAGTERQAYEVFGPAR